jgi:RecB family endonuclease NucS
MENSNVSFSPLHVESPATDPARDYAEKSLQTFLVQNPAQLGILQAKIIASEYPTDVGRIDLLVSSGQKTLWVVELKAGVAGRDAIGQIISYIGAVRQMHPGKTVLGLLVATDFDKSCLAAHRTINDVELKRVRIQYVLEQAVSMNSQLPSMTVHAHVTSSGATVRCSSCGLERQVSDFVEAFTCSACKAFNKI